MEALLGIDIGSTGCKAALYSLEGKLLGAGYRTYPMLCPQPGWVEEDPDEWWRMTAEAIRECVQKSGIPPHHILAATVSGANATIAIDRDGAVLYPAIMQLDSRTQQIAAELEHSVGNDLVFSITGNRIAPSMFSAPSILWLKQNRPELYERTWKFLSPNGFIVHRLTSEATMDYSRCSSSMLFDIRARQWSDILVKRIGVDRDKLPDAVPSEHIVGPLTRQAAEETGLPPGLPIAAGAQDTVTAAIGAGCVEAGHPLLVLGTVARICMPLQNDEFHSALNNRTYIQGTPYLASGGTIGGGMSMRWYLENFSELELQKAAERNISPYEVLDELALRAPKGSDSLLFLPYISSERAPIWDLNARGVFFGVTSRHGKPHIIRAIMEGVAYAIRQSMQLLENEMGYAVKDIKILGGGAKSELWRVIFADVLNRRILKTENADAETRGAAYMAGMAAGALDSYAGAESWAAVFSSQEPCPASAALYDRLFEIYSALYPQLKDIFIMLAAVKR